MTVEQTLRVTSIRSQDPHGFGGCIFSAKPIDEQGRILDATRYFVVKATGAALGWSLVEPGQWWKVAGQPSKRFLDVNGYRVAETQIDAHTAVLLRPSGAHIVAFMADNSAFEGVGPVKARKLWDVFGERLYVHLDSGNIAELATVLTPDSAARISAAWSQHGNSQTMQWLQAKGFDVALGRKVLNFFGTDTAQKLEEDPYRLLSFCATWRHTDGLARTHFRLTEDDPRRLQAAIEEACYRVFAAGHTWVHSSKLMDILQGVLRTQTKTCQWRKLIPTVLSQGLSNGSFVVSRHGVQPLGAMVMEREVAKALANRITDIQPALLPRDDVDDLLLAYEKSEGIELNPQQWEAVHLAAAKPLVLITGGAGVGKTTVLKALGKLYDCAGIAVTQLALAGRAAKRMQEATGRPASTIARFLLSCKVGCFDERSVVVIDCVFHAMADTIPR